MRPISLRFNRAAFRATPALLSAIASAVAFTAACSNDDRPGTAATRSATGHVAASAGEVAVDLRGEPYSVHPPTSSGAVIGRVTIAGRRDTANSAEQVVCGKAANTPPSPGLGNVVVWITDARSGKGLPIERRYQLDSDDCELDPAVQAMVTGSTVNVFNEDRILHRLVFTRLGAKDTITTMRFFNSGQLVASERLAKIPGIVEVRCVIHPWTHAYIAVFEHPYFAVTSTDGRFRIDSLPPGTYRLAAWHAGLDKPVEQDVKITAGTDDTADIAMKR